MITKKYVPHTFAISALFTVGNAVLLMYQFDLLHSAISLVSSLVLIGLSAFLLRRFKTNKLAFRFLLVVVGIISAYGAVTAFLDYIRFLKAEQMSQTNTMLLGALLLAIIIVFSVSKKTAIYKYGLFVFVVSVLIIVVCFASGINSFDFKNETVSLLSRSFSIKDFLRFFLPVVILPFWIGDESGIKTICGGVATAFLLLLVTALQVLLTFGQSDGVLYPYLKSVGVISSGSLFTRLDGLVWFLFFATALIKIAVCINAMLKIIKQK